MSASIVKLTGRVSSVGKRNIGIFAPVLQKASDPIQQLFLDKVKDYKSKRPEPSPEIQKELKSETERLYRQFNIKAGEDLSKFPKFEFTEPKLNIHRLKPKEESA